jgi:DNA-binding MurR/RpiR family transcriptional regulator
MNMTKDSVAIVVSVNGHFMGTASKMMKYLKKSKCKVVLITSEEKNFLTIPIDYRIKLSKPKDGKSGKHALLTTVELMSLRYYTLYSPSEKNKR